jgi:NAD-dependent dihydropyrimidine dehydrogenase PreA subunit
VSEQLHGIFIDVELDDSVVNDPAMAKKLAEVCPVDIYADVDGKTTIVRENLDECVLCKLCLEASPPGTVTVRKLYDGTTLER